MGELSRRLAAAIEHPTRFATVIAHEPPLEEAADLAIAAAVMSAATGRAVPGDVMMVGEVGLTGELRSVPEPARRISEAARLGFNRIVASRDRNAQPADGGAEWARAARLQQVGTLSEAMQAIALQDAALRAV